MNKSEFRGFKQVFLFELLTGIKKTGFKVFLGIICAIAFFTTPILVIVGNMNSDDSETKSNIYDVYVCNETDIFILYGNFDVPRYEDILFTADNTVAFDDLVANLEKDPVNHDLAMKISYDEDDGFDINIVRSSKSAISDADINLFIDDFKEFFRDQLLNNLNVSIEDYNYMSKEFDVTIMKADGDGSFAEDTSRFTYEDYFLIYGGLFAIFMFINMAVGTVATSVATEKSSRVIEFLLTGTRPLALLSGKITARLVETLITTFAAHSSYFLSQLVCVFLVSDRSATANASSNVVTVSSFWENLSVSGLVIAVLYFLAGLALFTIIGALTGASVSKLDELQDAYKLYSFILILCLYSDMFFIIMMVNSSGHEGLQNFLALFPLTGTFLTPALILTGKISTITGLIALIIIIATAVITFVLASAIYESMLLFQGKRLGAKDILKLMKKQVVT